MIPQLTIKDIKKEKKAFYASDYGKLECDLWCSLKNIEPTNPVKWNDTLKFGAGKGVEMQMLKVLKDSEIVPDDYSQEEKGGFKMERSGVEIHGYIDAINKNGEPIEIKSINNKNSIDIKKYSEGYPRENYVGQLSVYMDYLGKDVGHLFVSSIDGLSYFWLTCNKVKDRVYKCGHITVDLDVEYKRWAEIKDKVDKGLEPNWFEETYKTPVKDIEWAKVSKTDISKARNGDKVLGSENSWRIQYSSWKNMIIDKQGETIGYDEEELEFIKSATKGYTSK